LVKVTHDYTARCRASTLLGSVEKNNFQVIKRVLKLFVPPVTLKKWYLTYNRLKKRLWDPLVFRKLSLPRHAFAEFKEANPFLDLKIDLTRFPAPVKELFGIWTDPAWTMQQYVLYMDQQGFIEPETGWGLTVEKKLIDPSLGFAAADHVRKPGVIRTFFLDPGKTTYLESIISLRDTGEENYFHFFNDVIAKLFYLKEKGVDLRQYTLIVSRKLYNSQYFLFFLERTFLSAMRWHVQKDEWIRFERAIFCKPMSHQKRYFDQFVDAASDAVTVPGERRIFLTRPKSSLRFIENWDEVAQVLRKYQFEVIDAGQLTMSEQVSLFNQCRWLVGIHGAGMVNMIFRQRASPESACPPRRSDPPTPPASRRTASSAPASPRSPASG
jgi:hypothetical protein